MRFRKAIKCMASLLFYRILLLGCPTERAGCDEKEIAIVCIGALGDFIVSCSATRELFRQGKQLTLICREGTGIKEFAELTGYFTEVRTLRHSLLARAKNQKELQEVRAHTVLIMPPGRHILSDLYALSVRADKRIFPDTLQGCSLPKLKRITDQCADRLIPVNAVCEQERYEEYLKGAGLYNGAIRPFVFDDIRSTRKKPPEPYMMVFPGARGGKFKQWPVERFAYVANHLQKEYGYKILVCGTGKEQVLGEKLCGLLAGRKENLCGRTTLPTLGTLFRKASFVLANDTGSAHLSIAFGAPTVIICGGWEYGRFYPNPYLPENCRAICGLQKSTQCSAYEGKQIGCGGKSVVPCLLNVNEKDVLTIVKRCFMT